MQKKEVMKCNCGSFFYVDEAVQKGSGWECPYCSGGDFKPYGEVGDYFPQHETECKCGCGENRLNPQLLIRMNLVRERCGFAITPNSVARCYWHNLSESGSEKSSHLPSDKSGVTAWDARMPTNTGKRYALLSAMLEYFPRVGVARSFIHGDVDPGKVSPAMWVYK